MTIRILLLSSTQRRQDWVRSYFFTLEAGVIGLAVLFHLGRHHIHDDYGSWPSFAQLALLGLLLLSSGLALVYNRRKLAIVGFLVTLLTLADALVFPGSVS